MKQLNDMDFHNEIAKGNFVVDFWAEWCGPCRMMAQTFEELSKEMKNVNFAKINVDENPEVTSEFEVMSIPTLIIFKNGQEKDRIIGLMPKGVLKAKINEILNA